MLPAPEYQARTWTTEDSLPHNSASRVVQDTKGFLWFATVGGLARFDGREIREVRLPEEHRVQGFNIRGLAEEKPGTLVLLPASKSVLRLTGTAWSVHPVAETIARLDDGPADLHVDPKGQVWIATFGGRLVRWSEAGGAAVFEHHPGLVRGSRRFTFATDSDDNLFIGTDSLVMIPARGQPQTPAFASAEPHVVGAGREGRIWICTDGRLQVLERGHCGVVAESVPWRGEFDAVRQVFEDETGGVWIVSSRQGLFRYAEGRISRVQSPFSSALFIASDREGNLWVTSDGAGVGQLREKIYRVIDKNSGLRESLVRAIGEGPDGSVWLANHAGGLVSVASDGSVSQVLEGEARTAHINTVSVDATGRLWFGGGRQGLQHWSPGAGLPPVRLPVPQGELRLLFRARNGDVWFAGSPNPGQAGFYRGDVLRELTEADGFSGQDIRAIAEDQAGNIWLGGREGELMRWDGARLERFDAARGFPKVLIHAIHTDTENNLWIGTASGLVLKTADGFRLFTVADGLADDIVQQILDDDGGRLWCASRRGLFYTAKQDLLTAARDPSRRVTSHLLGRSQGLVGLNPSANFSPTACKTRDGRLWFATSQGALVVDPTRLPQNLPPPPLLLDEMRLDGAPVAFGTVEPRLNPSPQRIEFRFTAPSFTAPENVMVRHRLEGVDSEWVETGTDRIASYTNLPPGDYRLRAMARNSAGVWNDDRVLLAFSVLPAWREKTWVRLGALLLLVAASAALARVLAQRRLHLRLRRVEQEHALETERARIARDLHDELGASLTEVGLLADRLVNVAPTQLGSELSGLAWRTRRIATDLSSIVWTMKGSNSSLDRLAEFLRQYAERLFRNTGTRCTVRGVERIGPIPLAPEPQHQMLAAAKEAITNVLKHARATEASLTMDYREGVFELAIEDNGVGFDPAVVAAADGNGLRNLRARAAELGGTCDIAASPGQGTRITLRIPLPGRG